MPTCLVVDDSRAIRNFAKNILVDLGFDVSQAENGREAQIACESEMPDFILLDWNMPVMTGIEFVRELRKMPEGVSPKVIFCTTEDGVIEIQSALETGADEYITKPFDRQIVESKLELLDLI